MVVAGVFEKNLLKAIRLWVLFHLLYGDCDIRLNLVTPFTYADWRDTFFTETHPANERIPPLHDRDCLCARTAASWLFDEAIGLSESKWREALKKNASTPDKLDELLAARLFGVTRRSLAADLTTLAEIGWLKKGHRSQYS